MENAFLSLFYRVYVINLASRPDRRREMRRELDRAGFGADGAGTTFFDAIRPAAPGPFPSIGARGCFLSHLEVLRDAARRGCHSILICEDDLAFADDLASRTGLLCNRLGAEDWSVFYGGYAALPGATTGNAPLVEIAPEDGIQTTHCIGFRGDAIGEAAVYLAKMLDRPGGSPEGGPMHVDGAYSWYRRSHPTRRTLAAVPPIGHQRSSRSDVYDKLKWYDRVRVLDPFVHLLRVAKRRITPRG